MLKCFIGRNSKAQSTSAQALCYRDVKFTKPPPYNERIGAMIGLILHFFKKRTAAFHASLPTPWQAAHRRPPPGCREGLWPPEGPRSDLGPVVRTEAACVSRVGLSRPRWTRGPSRDVPGGCASQGSLDGASSLPRKPPGEQPRSPTDMSPATPLSPGKWHCLGAARQSRGCRVIGPFKSKLSAAGNKTLPFNSGIIRSGLETSQGKAFIEKRWENEI